MGTLIIDATVAIGLLDRADGHHHRAVADVDEADARGDRLLIPAGAYSECLVAFARAGRVAEAREALSGMGLEVTPLNGDIAEEAATLRARHKSLRLPDAMVLATARVLGGELLSYDHRLAELGGG